MRLPWAFFRLRQISERRISLIFKALTSMVDCLVENLPKAFSLFALAYGKFLSAAYP
jgi:hypothetical protein